MGEKIMYAVVIAAVALLAFAVFAMPSGRIPQAGGIPTGYGNGGGQALAFASPAQGTLPEECGNINDPKNLQHLSHHPDTYQECYKYIDPAKFRQATGQELSSFIRG